MPKLLVTIFFLGACFTTNAIAMSDSEKQRYVDFVKENLDRIRRYFRYCAGIPTINRRRDISRATYSALERNG